MKKPNTYLTGGQLHALARESGRYRSLVLLLGTAGLRWGEAAGLRVADIDFLRRKVLVHQNATGGTVETLKGGEHRTLVLAQYVIDELALTVRGKARNDLIWPAQTGSYLKSPSSHDSWLAGAVQRCQRCADVGGKMSGLNIRIRSRALPRSRGSLRTIFGTQRPAWRSRPGRM